MMIREQYWRYEVVESLNAKVHFEQDGASTWTAPLWIYSYRLKLYMQDPPPPHNSCCAPHNSGRMIQDFNSKTTPRYLNLNTDILNHSPPEYIGL